MKAVEMRSIMMSLCSANNHQYLDANVFLEGSWKEARDKKRELQNHRRLSSSQNFHAAAKPSSAGRSLSADCLQNVITEK